MKRGKPWPAPSLPSTSSARAAISPRSWPAEKARPSPVRTTTAMSPSSAASFRAAAAASYSAVLKALSASGRSRVRRRTRPWSSVRSIRSSYHPAMDAPATRTSRGSSGPGSSAGWPSAVPDSRGPYDFRPRRRGRVEPDLRASPTPTSAGGPCAGRRSGRALATAHDVLREWDVLSALARARRGRPGPRARGPVRGRLGHRRALLRHGLRRRDDPAHGRGRRGASTRTCCGPPAARCSTPRSPSTPSTSRPSGWATSGRRPATSSASWTGGDASTTTAGSAGSTCIEELHQRLSPHRAAGVGPARPDPRRLPLRQRRPRRRRPGRSRSSTGSCARSATPPPTPAGRCSTGPTPTTRTRSCRPRPRWPPRSPGAWRSSAATPRSAAARSTTGRGSRSSAGGRWAASSRACTPAGARARPRARRPAPWRPSPPEPTVPPPRRAEGPRARDLRPGRFRPGGCAGRRGVRGRR